MSQLLRTPLSVVGKLLVLYGLWFLTLALILDSILRVCNIRIKPGENLIINAYSTFLNYMMPGQGGPVLRGLYLKGRHGLPFRRYLFATVLYYAFYAAVGAILLVGGVRAWWQTLLGVIVVSAGAYVVARHFARKHQLSRRGLHLTIESIAYMVFATVLQAIVQLAIYWVELNTTSPGLQLGQVMSYTGAANFALFANITPGALGIRESFLIVSENLHHVTNAAIVATNVLDRATYLVFLAIVFVTVLALRGRSVFGFRRAGHITAEMVEGRQQPAPQPQESRA